MVTVKLISADSHVIEPAELWLERLDKKYRARAPHVFFNEARQGWFFGCDEIPPARINSLYAAAVTPEEFGGEQRRAGLEATRHGGFDPAARIKDMDQDGVAAEVLYTSLGLSLFWLEDPAMQLACFRVYNDWLAEFVSHARKRLIGLGLVPLWNVKDGVVELERCHKLGLKGAMIWGSPPRERPLYSTELDPFWRCAEELRMPVSLHILTGHEMSRSLFADDIPLGKYQRNLALPDEIKHSLTDMIFSGVLERFPTLRIVVAENDIGWLAYYLLHADRAHLKLGHIAPTSLVMKPSEYFRRQIYATFMEDEVGLLTVPLLGADNFMWGSDYPHYESTWPKSREIIARQFGRESAETRAKITHDNSAALYGIET
jgi:predicted TIM-barrel fold metal-dependent hydrolase